MHTIRILRAVFDDIIQPYEVPAFRGAVIEKAGREVTLFHNHENDGFRYAYPLIQYKRLKDNPMLMCIGEGVAEVYHFFSKIDGEMNMAGREISLRIKKLEMSDFSVQLLPQTRKYELRDWVALSQDSHKEYRLLQSAEAQNDFLRRKLIGNILSFAKGIGWQVEEDIKLDILSLQQNRLITIKGIKVMNFYVQFTCNVALPYGIGLGKHASMGCGVLGGRGE